MLRLGLSAAQVLRYACGIIHMHWLVLDSAHGYVLLFAVVYCTTLNKVRASDAVLVAKSAYRRR